MTEEVAVDTGPPICSAKATRHLLLNEMGSVTLSEAVLPDTLIDCEYIHCGTPEIYLICAGFGVFSTSKPAKRRHQWNFKTTWKH